MIADKSGEQATAIKWEQRPVAGSKLTHPGVYCLRSNQTDWSPETMWRTYIMLTDLEAVFRSLKSELGLRPIFHQKEHRSKGHLPRLGEHGLPPPFVVLTGDAACRA